MKARFFILFLSLFLFTFCAKEENDLRDQWIGVYDYNYTLVGEDDQGQYSDQGTGTLVVRKGATGQEMTFDDGTLDFPVDIAGQVFTIPLFVINIGGDDYELSGSGSFNGDQVQYSLQVEAVNFYDESTISVNGSRRE